MLDYMEALAECEGAYPRETGFAGAAFERIDKSKASFFPFLSFFFLVPFFLAERRLKWSVPLLPFSFLQAWGCQVFCFSWWIGWMGVEDFARSCRLLGQNSFCEAGRSSV